MPTWAFLAAAALIGVLAGASADDNAEPSATIWGRGSSAYLCAGTATPLWITPASDCFTSKGPLELFITMDARIEIVRSGTSPSGFIHPQPLIIPSSITSGELVDGRRTWTLILPMKAEFAAKGKVPRLALLVKPDASVAPGPVEIEMLLRDAASKREWPATGIEAEILPALRASVPKRVRIGAFNYLGYADPEYRSAIIETARRSGMNDLPAMHPVPTGDEDQLTLFRKSGGRVGAVMIGEPAQAVVQRLPESRRLDAEGKPIDGKLSYCWTIAHREETIQALAEHFRERNLAALYDVVINDIEERAFHKGHAYGDLHTPLAIETFRRQASIPADVALTPKIIADKYSQEWVDFRCWESTEWAGIVGEAVKRAGPDLVYGYYSGYHNAAEKADRTGQPLGTRAGYSTDWEMLGQAGFLDIGSAGYFGDHHLLADTRDALADTPFIPGEMLIENFFHYEWDMPSPTYFARRLMWALMTGGGHGVWTWYLQVFDAGAYSAIDQVSYAASRIEDIVLDGAPCPELLNLPGRIPEANVFVYRTGPRIALVVLNPTEARLEAKIAWGEALKGATGEDVFTDQIFNASAGVPIDIAPGQFGAYVVTAGGE